MVGGAAYAGKKRGERKAQQRAEADSTQGEAKSEAPAGTNTGDKLEQLKTLGELRDSGVLTEEEFEAEKQKLLAGQD